MELTNFELFHGLDQGSLNDVLGQARLKYFGENENIWHEGDASNSMVLIESGAVEVIIGEGKSQRVIAHLRQGDILGEMGLLTDAPRSASIFTVLPTLAFELTRESFTELVARYPAMLMNISRVLIERQKRAMQSMRKKKKRARGLADRSGRRKGCQRCDRRGLSQLRSRNNGD